MSGVGFQHGNHMVADLDKALAFYEAVLGFDVTYILPSNSDSYSYPVFDIPREAVIAGAKALGRTVYGEEVLHTNDGRVGREIGIVGFDDNLVVIYKILEVIS